MPNPRRRAESWPALLDLVWPSIRKTWMRAVAAERRRMEVDTSTPRAWSEAMWSWALEHGWDLNRWSPPSGILLVEVRVPGGTRLRTLRLSLIDSGAKDHGEAELNAELREALGLLPVPLSGTLEIRFSALDNRKDAVRWRRKIGVGTLPAGPGGG